MILAGVAMLIVGLGATVLAVWGGALSVDLGEEHEDDLVDNKSPRG
ncbi:hypothetical protein SAMN05421630_106328 [Prauserella marina]|uniref:Uncharacterized protein n=1 Tax=Prauserella marina TaxID=530584 RepID=A0A1G6SSL7_9PSEU|nr:hypothetical protein [Prauserella marina]PWV82092.1 hypothetical protein DES30_102328 [Prauserella marina]SDD19217.1 hypothetical protein SAMN05421630_106328 [Prauserella marina]